MTRSAPLQRLLLASLGCLGCLVTPCAAFASWMVNEHCLRLVQPGQVIMNEVVQVSDERRVRVHRSFFTESGEERVEELLSHNLPSPSPSSAVFFPGEELTLSVSLPEGAAADSSTEFLFETDRGAGRFLGEETGCGHSRTAVSRPVLTLPRYRTEVKVWVGWAAEHGLVQVSRPFLLLPTPDLAVAWEAKPEPEREEVEEEGRGKELTSKQLRREGGETRDDDADDSFSAVVRLKTRLMAILFSSSSSVHLGPLVVVAVLVCVYLLCSRVFANFLRKGGSGSAKDQ